MNTDKPLKNQKTSEKFDIKNADEVKGKYR